MKRSLTPWRYFLLILVLTLENHFNILQLSKRQSKNNIEDKKNGTFYYSGDNKILNKNKLQYKESTDMKQQKNDKIRSNCLDEKIDLHLHRDFNQGKKCYWKLNQISQCDQP